MKRILTLLLAMMLVAGMLVGCGDSGKETNYLEEEDKGAVVNVYIGSEIRNWDPALTYTQASAVKFFSLTYEGLTRVTADGKLENALAKDIKIIENEEDNEYMMQIQLIDTAWSDGRQLSADDVIYAWKRLLEPDFQSSACCMLYDIKNARAVRSGDATIDDLGLEALDTTLLQITFEGKIDYDLFLEYCASPALVPLREDVVGRYSDLNSGEYWGKKSATILSSGPFCVKNMDSELSGKTLTLQRNNYYHSLEGTKDGKFEKNVTPYRMNMNFGFDSDGRVTAYEYDYKSGEVKINSNITLSAPSDQILYLGDVDMNTKGATVQDTLSVFSLLVNCRNETLSKADVRQALSVSLDRTKIAEILSNTKPAAGLVPNGVYYSKLGGEFYRSKAGDMLSASADAAKAKSLLSSAGVNSGSIRLTYYRGREGAADVAEYIKQTWESLGFTVTLDEKGINQYSTKLLPDVVTGAYDFDVVALDYQAVSSNAFSTLAPFALPFSGSAKDTKNNDFSDAPSISGYENADYDKLMEEIYATSDREEKGAKLVEAEKMLLEDAPIIPLVYNVDAYIFNSSILSKIGSNYYGGRIFTKMKMKNYKFYKPADPVYEDTDTEEGSEPITE